MFNNKSQPVGSVVAPATPPAQPAFGAPMNGGMPAGPNPYSSNTQSSATSAPAKKSHATLILSIILVLSLILIAVLTCLFLWAQTELTKAQTNVDGQIDVAVATAISENTTELENQFAEREKYPYRTFAAPADLGSVTFEYPKTWSIYISAEGNEAGSNFAAIMNPVEVYSASMNAMSISIQTMSYEEAISRYQEGLRNGAYSLAVRNVGSTTANVYTGKLSQDIDGGIAIFRIRDKVVAIRVNAPVFLDEFYRLLDSITFIE